MSSSDLDSVQTMQEHQKYLQMEALGLRRRDKISTADYKENKTGYRPVAVLQAARQLKGDLKAPSSEVKTAVNGWNSAWIRLEHDGTADPCLRKVNEGLGQTHRAKLLLSENPRVLEVDNRGKISSGRSCVNTQVQRHGKSVIRGHGRKLEASTNLRVSSTETRRAIQNPADLQQTAPAPSRLSSSFARQMLAEPTAFMAAVSLGKATDSKARDPTQPATKGGHHLRQTAILPLSPTKLNISLTSSNVSPATRKPSALIGDECGHLNSVFMAEISASLEKTSTPLSLIDMDPDCTIESLPPLQPNVKTRQQWLAEASTGLDNPTITGESRGVSSTDHSDAITGSSRRTMLIGTHVDRSRFVSGSRDSHAPSKKVMSHADLDIATAARPVVQATKTPSRRKAPSYGKPLTRLPPHLSAGSS